MMNAVDNLIDQNFAWFTGVVEDVADPMQMGRVRVRCIGYHTEDKNEIPTNALPWAVVMTPIQSASMSGIGQSATGVLPGSWVIGFFRDGRSAQDPIVLGTIPSYSTKADKTKGFSDPDGKYPLRDGLDTPVEATANFSSADTLAKRESFKQTGIKKASIPEMSGSAMSASPEQTWSMKSRSEVVAPEYPKNQVFRSESGHVREIDDTPEAERTLDMHKTGTYVEVDADGDKTTVVVGDNYEVIIKDNNVYVKGECHLTVDGNLRTYVKGNYILEVEGDKFEKIKGNRYSSVKDFDHMDSKQAIIAVDNTATVTLKGSLPDLSDIDPGLSGITLVHPEIVLAGNVNNTIGASGSFTSSDKKNITITNGLITNILRS